MPAKTNTTEYETVVVGAAYLVKNILRKLGFVSAIDEVLTHQPEIDSSYGQLAQVLVANRLAFQPVPLYEMAEWVAEQGLDRVFEVEATWLDDDRLGAMLEALAKHQVSIWSRVVKNAVDRFGVELGQLHSDTTSVYFEGQYEDDQGRGWVGTSGCPCWSKVTTKMGNAIKSNSC